MDDDAPHPFTPDHLDTSGLPATTEDLRQVLGRHRRHQARALGAGLVGVLVAGAIAGFAVGRDGAHTTTLNAGPASSPSTHAAAATAPELSTSGSSVGASPITTPAVQLLLRNATDGTRVRLYQRTMDAKVECQPAGSTCPPPPSCMPTSLVSAEVSDDQVAGAAMAPVWNVTSTDALQALDAQVVGEGEPQPILVVIAKVTPAVTKVTMTTAYGTDTAIPTTAGWVALAEQLPPTWTAAPDANVPDGTVTATTATGATAGSASIPKIRGKNPPKECQPPPCTAPTSGASSSSGSTGQVTPAAPQTPEEKKVCAAKMGPGSPDGPETGGVSSSGGVVAPAVAR